MSEAPAAGRIEVAAAIIRRGGRILITKRPEGGHLAGLWEFPGGKRKAGESFEECLRRECREELGVDVEVSGRYEEVFHAYPEKEVLLRFYFCALAGGEPAPIGVSDLRWVRPEELAGFEFPAADARVLRALVPGAGGGAAGRE